MLIISSWLMVLSNLIMTLLIFFLLDLSISDKEVSKFPTIMVDLCFSLQFYQFLPHIVWYSFVRTIHVNCCYGFVRNWPLYYYAMSFFMSESFLAMKTALSEIHIDDSTLFWLVLAWYFFHHLFISTFTFKVNFL